MEYDQIDKKNLQEATGKLLKKLITDQEKKPLRIPLQFGYLAYIKLFTESFERADLADYFPYAGFPMEWSRGDEKMEGQQRIWQLSYQMQYCASLVEPGHFMEEALLVENEEWAETLCRYIDWLSEHAQWNSGIPKIFGKAMEEMISRIYDMGNSGIFLTPSCITDMMVEMADEKEKGTLWNPSCRTGEFLTSSYKRFPLWEIEGTESEKESGILAAMLQFYYGGKIGNIHAEDVISRDQHRKYDIILSNLPVGDLDAGMQERFPVATRKIQLQYLQRIMDSLKEDGQALVIVTEGTLFKFDAEMKVRELLVDQYNLQGVVSLPADAFLPYTGSKASVLIFAGKKSFHSRKVWFYELDKPGYTLDKYRHKTNDSQIPNLMIAWKERAKMEDLWNLQMQQGVRKNQWDNPVPQIWQETHFWFADIETIRDNDYNLTAGRYKPWKETQEQITESPAELLQHLSEMEKETMNQITELLEITRKYG